MLLLYLLVANVIALGQTTKSTYLSAKRNIPFDDNWRFIKKDINDAKAEKIDDSNWRTVDLPHDWSVEDLPNQKADSVIGPFYRKAVGGIFTGFTMGGTGWYRKRFALSQAFKNKKVIINFDGVYMNSDIWINGHHLGNHAHGYTPFFYDLTTYLRTDGRENVLAVRVKNEGSTSRWYSGSGIYRHVWLTVTDPIHLTPWGVSITTPEVNNSSATVRLKAEIKNESKTARKLNLITTIVSSTGQVAGKSQQEFTLEAGNTTVSELNIPIKSPQLWSVNHPKLYKANVEIEIDKNTVDKTEIPFGIRSLSITAQKGLLLNGQPIKLKGGCIHHDNGPLGAAAIDRAEERKIEILKKNGFNAVRLSHNPPSTQLLNACDKLGMLVIDEAFDTWEVGKMPQDYHLYFKENWEKDLKAMIYRDRNHPSIILWSIGNEITERVDSLGLAIGKRLASKVRELDSSRPVTAALCAFWDHPGYKWESTEPAFALLDVSGYNYLWNLYESDHEQFPERIILGSESHPKDALENWNLVEKHPYILGDFVWTAMDYLGEASTGNAALESTKKKKRLLRWPWFNAWCGDIDLIGNKKPQSYYRDVVWRNRPITMAVHEPIPDGMVENMSDWGWPLEAQSWTWPGAEGKSLQVRVFSRAPLVRLLFNGKIIGEQKIADKTITAIFEVPYQPGTLKAVNIENGKETDEFILKTTETPKNIRLVADRKEIKASRNDLSYVAVEVTDENGSVVPNAEYLINFSIQGEGEVAGVGNASPTKMASFQRLECKTIDGKCLAIVRPTGKIGTITLQASAKGLKPTQIKISTR